MSKEKMFATACRCGNKIDIKTSEDPTNLLLNIPQGWRAEVETSEDLWCLGLKIRFVCPSCNRRAAPSLYS